MAIINQAGINNATSNVQYSNNIFRQLLLQIASGIVWKNTTLANSKEPEDTTAAYQSELFVVANRGLLNFSVIKAFPRVVLQNAGASPVDIDRFATDKDTIPQAQRQIYVDEYARALTTINPITNHYEYYDNVNQKWIKIYDEQNDYYRMLMGLPNVDDTDFVYNTDKRWPTDIPIHEMDYVDRIEMENEGVLAQLIAKYPTKEYLKHVGRRAINFFEARIAERFEILYYDESTSDTLNKDFMDTYNRCRYMTMNVYYNLSFTKSNKLYDNFMAMSILFATLLEMQRKYLEVDITRDFYDVESLKVVYDSYSVPFYDEIPLDYHRRIVKRMNQLISYKGSSEVFFDLFEIFDLASMDIYQYFITKVHRLDENGMPTFIPKEDEDGNPMYDEEGNLILDPSNYTLQFSKVKLNEDPALAVSDRANDIDYEYLTVPDPYWIEDYDLQQKLANESFNYLETKYIGIQTIFDLMKITYENAYIFRLITDNKDLTDRMSFRWTDLGIECSIFDIFIYLASLYCRYYNYEGMIDNWIPAVMDTLGYNYQECRDILIKARQHKYLGKNTELISLIASIQLTNLNSINDNYDAMMEILDVLYDGYCNARTREEFFAYRDLYYALMSSREVTAVYTDPTTGEIFETFTDVLAEYCPDLMQRYLILSDEEVLDEMTITINQIEKLITSMRYLPYSAGVSSSAMIESLFKILQFFKSAKVELIGYDITYKITMRGANFFKMLDLIWGSYTETWIDEPLNWEDFINTIASITRCVNDTMPFVFTCKDIRERTKLKDYILCLIDEIHHIFEKVEHTFEENHQFEDALMKVITENKLFDKLNISEKDSLFLTSLIFHESRITKIRDEIKYLVDELIDNGQSPPYIIDQMLMYDEIIRAMDVIHTRSDQLSSSINIIDILYLSTMNSLLELEVQTMNDILLDATAVEILEDNQILKDFLSGTIIENIKLTYSEQYWIDFVGTITDSMKLDPDGPIFDSSKVHDLILDTSKPTGRTIYQSIMNVIDCYKHLPNGFETEVIHLSQEQLQMLEYFFTFYDPEKAVDEHPFTDKIQKETTLDDRIKDDIQTLIDTFKVTNNFVWNAVLSSDSYRIIDFDITETSTVKLKNTDAVMSQLETKDSLLEYDPQSKTMKPAV